VGSYDGHVRLFDIRKPPVPLASSDVGGGAWRVKWHPSVQRKHDLLAACMHGGFKIVRWSSDEDVTGHLPATETNGIATDFQGHESLAYGVDWRTPEPNSDVRNDTLIASCSFYDHSLKTWRA
jgi:diphthine methyl ester acylhydrolase